jgi:Ca-activated chloride channel family protein
MEGNFFSARRLYAEAIAAFTRALEFAETRPYAEYGLGAVYLVMEESAAALVRFEAAEKALAALGPSRHRELSYRLHYNTGVIRFHQGDFTVAAAKFRQALEIDSSRIEAKRNLELSLLSASQPESASSVPAEIVETRARREAVFDYLRQKEQDQWKSREWAEDDSATGPDY